MHEVTLLIVGESRGASDGKTFERINPASGKPASRAAAATLADADAAVAAAARAFPAWSALAPTERRKRLLAAADLMDARTAQFIETGNADAGFVALSLVLSPKLANKGRSLEVPPALYATVPLDHAAVLTTRGTKNPAAKRYLDFLASEPARKILREYGYHVP